MDGCAHRVPAFAATFQRHRLPDPGSRQIASLVLRYRRIATAPGAQRRTDRELTRDAGADAGRSKVRPRRTGQSVDRAWRCAASASDVHAGPASQPTGRVRAILVVGIASSPSFLRRTGSRGPALIALSITCGSPLRIMFAKRPTASPAGGADPQAQAGTRAAPAARWHRTMLPRAGPTPLPEPSSASDRVDSLAHFLDMPPSLNRADVASLIPMMTTLPSVTANTSLFVCPE